MGYGKRKQWKRTPVRRFSRYLHGAIGAGSGAALGYISNGIPGGLAGIGSGWLAGRNYYRRNYGLSKSVMRKKLSSNKSGMFRSRSGTKKVLTGTNPRKLTGTNPRKLTGTNGKRLTGSNPGHVFGSNPGPSKPSNAPKRGGWTGTDLWARGKGHRKGHVARRKTYRKF